jgi:hypothetical protein
MLAIVNQSYTLVMTRIQSESYEEGYQQGLADAVESSTSVGGGGATFVETLGGLAILLILFLGVMFVICLFLKLILFLISLTKDAEIQPFITNVVKAISSFTIGFFKFVILYIAVGWLINYFGLYDRVGWFSGVFSPGVMFFVVLFVFYFTRQKND